MPFDCESPLSDMAMDNEEIYTQSHTTESSVRIGQRN